MSNTNKNELQAYFYANQGMEIVKSIGFSAIQGETCTDSFKLNGVNFGTCDPTSDAYEDLGNPFERYFKFSEIGSPVDAYKVTSIIEWTDSTGAHDLAGGAVKVSQIIY